MPVNKRSRRTRKNRRRNLQKQKGGTDSDKNIVIYQEWGGLGDNLQFTTLPELYSKQGYNVYISSKNAYRSDELYDLIWKLNPFVKGISDLPPNAGQSKDIKLVTDSFIKNIEIAHGLHDGTRKYPVIYYKPKKIEGIDGYIFYDPTSVTTGYNSGSLKTSFQSVFDKYPKLVPNMIKFKKGYKNIKNNILKSFTSDVYEINDIYHFCDVLYSCKVFITGFSGASVLGSAVKQDESTPEIYSFYEGTLAQKPSIYMFDNVTYMPTK